MSYRFILMAAGVAGLSLGMVDTSHADIWVKDPTTGCQVWSGDDGTSKEIISWSGACADDKAIGMGTLVTTDIDGLALVFNGEMYFGDMNDGARDGFGTLVHANDDSYVGEFEKGVASGVGIYEYDNGGLVMGEYAAGAPNGRATVIDANDVAYQGVFKDGQADGLILVTKADGSQSVETWVNGEKQE